MRIICVHVCIYYTKIIIILAVFMLSLTIFASKKITDSCSTNSQLMYRRHIYVPKTLRCMSQNTLLYVHFKTAIQNYMHIYYVCLYTARVLYLDTRSLYIYIYIIYVYMLVRQDRPNADTDSITRFFNLVDNSIYRGNPKYCPFYQLYILDPAITL